ncbi:hypothetical protein [Mycoplasma elephantis]|uniref:hypothetical protein n=1 Tax=Mycoplasma elephantis TaxID=114882 RepID=UPI0004845620|nr:hypothetical protein [Mycoplasma elephantis]
MNTNYKSSKDISLAAIIISFLGILLPILFSIILVYFIQIVKSSPTNTQDEKELTVILGAALLIFYQLFFGLGVAGFVLYIMTLVNSFAELKEKRTGSILMLVGFFVPIVGWIGLFKVYFAYKKKCDNKNE